MRSSILRPPPWSPFARDTGWAAVRAVHRDDRAAKELDTLIEAFAGLPASIREEHELVIAGPMGWASNETRARLQSARYLGYVPEGGPGPADRRGDSLRLSLAL